MILQPPAASHAFTRPLCSDTDHLWATQLLIPSLCSKMSPSSQLEVSLSKDPTYVTKPFFSIQDLDKVLKK